MRHGECDAYVVFRRFMALRDYRDTPRRCCRVTQMARHSEPSRALCLPMRRARYRYAAQICRAVTIKSASRHAKENTPPEKITPRRAPLHAAADAAAAIPRARPYAMPPMQRCHVMR